MSNDTKSGTGSSAQRPHATLDLKAERVEDPALEESASTEPESSAEEPRAPVETTPPREGGGAASFLTHLSAGLLGGLIALVVGYYALGNFRDRLPFISDTSAEQIKAAQQSLDQRISQVAQAAGEARAALADRVDALTSRTEGLARTDDEAVVALAARVDALAQQVETAAGEPGDTASADQIASLSEQINGLQQSISALRNALQEVRAQGQQSAARARGAALAVAVNLLRQAVDGGDAYAAQLEAVRSLSREPLEAGALAAAAENGVPTLRELRGSFPQYANRALDAVGATGDDSIIGQIVESARSVVNVRPVGEIEGDTPSAIIARMENRLEAGDLPGVVAQSDGLTGAAAVQLVPWLEQVKTRIDAEKELDALEARMFAAIQR